MIYKASSSPALPSYWGRQGQRGEADKAGTPLGAPEPQHGVHEDPGTKYRQITSARCLSQHCLRPRNIQGASVRKKKKKTTFREPLIASEKRKEVGGKSRTSQGIDPEGRHPGKEGKCSFLLPFSHVSPDIRAACASLQANSADLGQSVGSFVFLGGTDLSESVPQSHPALSKTIQHMPRQAMRCTTPGAHCGGRGPGLDTALPTWL